MPDPRGSTAAAQARVALLALAREFRGRALLEDPALVTSNALYLEFLSRPLARTVLHRIAGERYSRIRYSLALLREMLASANGPDWEVTWVSDALKSIPSARLIVISWPGVDHHGTPIDSYFGTRCFDEREVVWILLGEDAGAVCKLPPNVVVISPVTQHATLRRIARVFARLARAAARGIADRRKALLTCSLQTGPASEVGRVLAKTCAGWRPGDILIPWENQPSQLEVVRALRDVLPDWRVNGVVHAVLPPMPAHYAHAEPGAPDRLVVPGRLPCEIFTQVLAWPADRVVVAPSMRYRRAAPPRFPVEPTIDVFVSRDLVDEAEAFRTTVSLLRDCVVDAPCSLRVHLHPDRRGYPSHEHFRRELELQPLRFEARTQDRCEGSMRRNSAIVVGASGVLLDLIEQGRNVLVVATNSLFELRQEPIWTGFRYVRQRDSVYRFDAAAPFDVGAYRVRGEEGLQLVDWLDASANPLFEQ